MEPGETQLEFEVRLKEFRQIEKLLVELKLWFGNFLLDLWDNDNKRDQVLSAIELIKTQSKALKPFEKIGSLLAAKNELEIALDFGIFAVSKIAREFADIK